MCISKIYKKQKAQGALEYLLLIGGAVLVAVIIIGLIIANRTPGKKSAELQLEKNAKVMDSSLLAPTIDSVVVISGSCVDKGLGDFNLSWLPSPSSSVDGYSVIVEDFYGNVLEAKSNSTGDSNLNVNVLLDTITLNLSNNNCTDTFFVSIRLKKDNLEVISKPSSSFSWYKSAIVDNLILGPTENQYVSDGEIVYFVADTEGISYPHCYWYVDGVKFSDGCLLKIPKEEFNGIFGIGSGTLSLKINDVDKGSRSLNIVDPAAVSNYILAIGSPSTKTTIQNNTEFEIKANIEPKYYMCKWYYKKYGDPASNETLFKTSANCSSFKYDDVGTPFAPGDYMISVVLYDKYDNQLDALNVYPIHVN